ncbi:MAG: alkaline phosphatase [Bacteroidetes bacterium]|nr:alkaline phosphatase [Bacteroidota bacterium]
MRDGLAGLFVLCLLTAPPALAQPAGQSTHTTTQAPENVILLIPDGFGPASATFARDYLRATSGRFELAFDSLHIGSTRTASSDSRITDSAAAGTALATGHKTYNGAISVDSTGRPVAHLVEAAEARGMTTGLVVTSRITHATPAVFSAHVRDRGEEDRIAVQQLDAGIEILMGGGLRHFLPDASGGQRTDGRNLVDEATEAGYHVVRSASALKQAPREGALLGLFADSHMAYEIDRAQTQQPRLATMTRHALDRLSGSENGFFLMVEGSRIDHAGHSNDAAAHLQDILAFEEAVTAALDYARSDGETLVLVLSDHETGGLSVGRNRDGEGIYEWHPAPLAKVTASQGAMVRSIMDGSEPERVLATSAGIDSLRAEETERLRAATGNPRALHAALSEIIGRRSLVGWTSLAHTAVDVSTYAYGPGWEAFIGSHENTYIAHALARLLDADLEALTPRSETTEIRSR